MDKLDLIRKIGSRPFSATKMLWDHRRTLRYLWWSDKTSFKNHIFTTLFIRGEDCGKGVLDPIWKLTGNAPFLWDLEMEVTTACYLKCIHCEHTYFDKSYLNQHLTLDSLCKVLDIVPNLKWINLTGEGTAILNPQFNLMVEEVKKRGIYLDFSHDFVKLSEGTAEWWVLNGVDRIYWSFDGCTMDTYEGIRIGANFERVQRNVRTLIDIKKRCGSPLPEICFRYTFFKDNVHEVDSIIPFLYGLVDGDVKLYGDEPSINIVALLEFDETRGWECEIPQNVVDKVNQQAKELGFKVYWSHITHIEEDKAPMDYCTFWSEPYIMITGHVVPCCAVLMSNSRSKLERLAFGNINEQSLKAIWDSKYFKEFRKAVVNPKAPVPEVCLGCRAFNTQTRARRYGIW